MYKIKLLRCVCCFRLLQYVMLYVHDLPLNHRSWSLNLFSVFALCIHMHPCIFLLEHPGASCICTWAFDLRQGCQRQIDEFSCFVLKDILSDSKSMLILGPPGVWVLTEETFLWHLLANFSACCAHAAIVFRILFAWCKLQMFMLLASVLNFAMPSEADTVGYPTTFQMFLHPECILHPFVLFRHCRVLVCSTKHIDKFPRELPSNCICATWDAA